MNTTGSLNAERRAAAIRIHLEKGEPVQVGTLAKELGVSEMTIRRDLEELEGGGIVRRVRGGAVPVGPTPFAMRHERRSKAKTRIAAKLLPLVGTDGAIGVDASSTLLLLVAAVKGAGDLTVVTNGPDAFTALQGRPGVTALLTGGRLDVRTGSLVGSLAIHAARDLLLRRLFVSAAMVDAQFGPSESCLEEAEVKRSFGTVASEIVLAVDSSKLGNRALAQTFEWDEVSLLVTELPPDDHRLDPYRHLVAVM
jgi:DeoR family transcriptional regulator, fructose operon transcriptional repressor